MHRSGVDKDGIFWLNNIRVAELYFHGIKTIVTIRSSSLKRLGDLLVSSRAGSGLVEVIGNLGYFDNSHCGFKSRRVHHPPSLNLRLSYGRDVPNEARKGEVGQLGTNHRSVAKRSGLVWDRCIVPL